MKETVLSLPKESWSFSEISTLLFVNRKEGSLGQRLHNFAYLLKITELWVYDDWILCWLNFNKAAIKKSNTNSGYFRQNRICRLDNKYCININFLIWIIVLLLNKTMSLFLGNTCLGVKEHHIYNSVAKHFRRKSGRKRGEDKANCWNVNTCVTWVKDIWEFFVQPL